MHVYRRIRDPHTRTQKKLGPGCVSGMMHARGRARATATSASTDTPKDLEDFRCSCGRLGTYTRALAKR